MNYYNEWDRNGAAWIRELINQGLIPYGDVDERSISDVRATELSGYTQCHFFAGISGWSLALRLAGWPSNQPVWTGSCPCQPFSVAGKGKATEDKRHLWPELHRLISECCPPVVFGEQVAGKAGLQWLDGVSTDMEDLDYAFGASDLCAASLNSPQVRQRLFWVGYSPCAEKERLRPVSIPVESKQETGGSGLPTPWEKFEVVGCADGKARRVEPGLECLVNGLPFKLADGRAKEDVSRKALLYGFGNAIVPPLAAEFIKAFVDLRDY